MVSKVLFFAQIDWHINVAIPIVLLGGIVYICSTSSFFVVVGRNAIDVFSHDGNLFVEVTDMADGIQK